MTHTGVEDVDSEASDRVSAPLSPDKDKVTGRNSQLHMSWHWSDALIWSSLQQATHRDPLPDRRQRGRQAGEEKKPYRRETMWALLFFSV